MVAKRNEHALPLFSRSSRYARQWWLTIRILWWNPRAGGVLYRPLPEWLNPVVEWAEEP